MKRASCTFGSDSTEQRRPTKVSRKSYLGTQATSTNEGERLFMNRSGVVHVLRLEWLGRQIPHRKAPRISHEIYPHYLPRSVGMLRCAGTEPRDSCSASRSAAALQRQCGRGNSRLQAGEGALGNAEGR